MKNWKHYIRMNPIDYRIKHRYWIHVWWLVGLMTLFGCNSTQDWVRPMTWPRENNLISSGQYRSVAIADLDKDGFADVVGAASTPGTIAIWHGMGNGTLSEPTYLPLKGDIRSVVVGDFNEDQLPDIAFSVQRETSGVLTWVNLGNRKWKPGTAAIEGSNYQGVRVADINHDRHLDLIAANMTSRERGGIQVWLGDGQGNWLLETGPTDREVFMDVLVADFDNDGHLDLAGAGWGNPGTLEVWLGDGRGGWSTTPPVARGSFYGLSYGDVNGDGHGDLLAGTYRNGIRLFYGNGKGDFQAGPAPENEGNYWKVIPFDLDADGTPELIAGSMDAKGISTWKYQGNGVWSRMVGRFPETGMFYGIAVGDLNGDHFDDICAASFGEGIKIWFGKRIDLDSSRATDLAKGPKPTASIGMMDPLENEVYVTEDGIAQYKIGTGDILEITLWQGTKSIKEEVRVREGGVISFSYIDDVQVEGLTPAQLDELITNLLKTYIVNPRVDVMVKKYRSKTVTLFGAISILPFSKSGPGTYVLTGKTRLMEKISEAGGPTKDANLRNVRVRRKDGKVLTLDLYKSIIHGDKSQDIVLDDGDLIYVSTITKQENRVYVFGEVERPGVYTFSGGTMRLFDAISQAGGVTVFGKPQITKIVRGDITRPEVIGADLAKLIEQGDQTQNLELSNGDLVYVPRSFIGDVNLFVKRISPLLYLIYAPAQFRDAYGFESDLRLP